MTTTVAPPPEVRVRAPRARRGLGDRLNPILVKEVRQALRGRYFRALFTMTLVFATVVGLLVVAAGSREAPESIGVGFFMVMFGCMAAAAHAFTPFWAFLSTSGEWDENTHDLLVLSNLKPRQIVLGKLLSALVQALLYYSTFGPFLVFAFLLNGVDLVSITVILASSLTICVALTLVGIALASMARTRAARGLLMAVFGAGLGVLWLTAVSMAGALVQAPQVLRGPEGRIAVLVLLTVAAVVGGFFAAIALGRFAHEEENRSSGMRVYSLSIVLIAGAWGAWLVRELGEVGFAWALQLGAGGLLLLPWLAFLTEPEPLGRRARKHVDPRAWVALLSAPFLPGGGRAVLLFLLQCAAALACTWIGVRVGPAASSVSSPAVAYTEVALFYAYAFVFLALPAAIGGAVLRSPRARVRLRMMILVGVPLVILGPAVLGLVSGNESWMELEHPFNPLWVMTRVDHAGSGSQVFWSAVLVLAIGVLAGLGLNAPRVVSGVREVLGASRAARAAARRRGA